MACLRARRAADAGTAGFWRSEGRIVARLARDEIDPGRVEAKGYLTEDRVPIAHRAGASHPVDAFSVVPEPDSRFADR